MANDTTRRSAVERLAQGGPPEAFLVPLQDSIKIGVKGPSVLAWLGDHTVPYSEAVYGTERVSDGSLVVRIASDEFIVESTLTEGSVQRIDKELSAYTNGVYRVEQQSESLILKGSHAPRVWAETCGVNVVREPTDRIIYTRVAGIACGIIPEGEADNRSYRIWVDYSYAPDLYKTILEILSEKIEH